MNGSNLKKRNKVMENQSEKQTPDLVEVRKTLVGLGNVLVQAGLADGINYREWSTIGSVSFQCGDFAYDIPLDGSYDEESYRTFVENIKSYLKAKVKDYEERIFALECSKAVIEVYFSEKK